MVLSCLTWIHDTVERFIVGKKFDINLFPDDVIIEILARLPAEDVLKCRKLCRQWESLTSAPYFIELHVKRATPSLFMQFSVDGSDSTEFICSDDADKKLKYSELHSKLLKDLSWYNPRLVGSCHGLLLFEASFKKATKFFVINLITEERVSVIPPLKPGHLCSIFFHPSTRDYIVLYWHKNRHEYHNTHSGYCYRYFSYSLHAKTWKEITPCFTYRPAKNAISIVLVNGSLHWMASQHTEDNAIIPPCKDAIMVYNIDNEEFRAFPHPGPQCPSRKRHKQMSIFEMKEEVIFIHVSYKSPMIDIWALEDYENWGWVKRYEVDLGWMNSNICCPSVDPWLDYHFPKMIRILNLQNDELLFDWTSKGVYCYNLKLKKVWEITTLTGIDRKHERYGRAVAYTGSFVSPR